MGSMYFALAVVIAVLGLTFIYKRTYEKIGVIVQENSKDIHKKISKAQNIMFLQSAVFEIIPILLIVIGFIDLPSETLSPKTVVTLLISIGGWIVGVMAARRMKKVAQERLPNGVGQLLSGLLLIQIMTMSAFPVISIICHLLIFNRA